MNRRSLLRATALAIPFAALAACGGSPSSAPTAIAADLRNALGVIKADVALVPGVSAALVAQVQQYADEGLTVLESMLPTVTAEQGATVLAQAVAYLNAALSALPAVLPPPFNLYVQAAAAIALSVEQFVAQATASVPTGVPASVARRANGMSTEQARSVLASARKGR